jgi:hypothetical protein
MDMTITTIIIPGVYALLHLAGLMLALVYWRRCPKACTLLFTASSLGLLTMTLLALFFGKEEREKFLGPAMGIASVSQWISHGILLVAVFAGRNDERPRQARPPRPFSDHDDDDWRPPKPKPPADSTGIQS